MPRVRGERREASSRARVRAARVSCVFDRAPAESPRSLDNLWRRRADVPHARESGKVHIQINREERSVEFSCRWVRVTGALPTPLQDFFVLKLDQRGCANAPWRGDCFLPPTTEAARHPSLARLPSGIFVVHIAIAPHFRRPAHIGCRRIFLGLPVHTSCTRRLLTN